MFGRTASGLVFIGRTLVPGYDLTVPLFPIVGVGNDYVIQPFTTTGHASAVPSA